MQDIYLEEKWERKVPQLAASHAMIDSAIALGLPIFIILTHLDNYHKQYENIIVNQRKDSTDKVVDADMAQQAGEVSGTEHFTSLRDLNKLLELEKDEGVDDGRLGEDMLGELKGIYLQLSQR